MTDIVIAVVMCKFLYMHYKADLTQRSDKPTTHLPKHVLLINIPRTASMIKVLVHHTITTGLLTRLFCNLFYILLALLIIFDSVSTVVYVAVVRTIAFIPAFLLVNPLMRLV